MQAIYDLSRYPASFNFIEFLVAASTRGADHVLFDKSNGIRKKYTDEHTEQRIKTILEPACALAGCTFECGSGEGLDPGYHVQAVLKAFAELGRIKKLISVLPARNERYTVTLRNSQRKPQRNSNREEWLRFAKEIGAFVIEDYSDKPIHLHERMAYYAGAKMNYFVANGPTLLCMYSDLPYTAFISSKVNEQYHREQGWYKQDLPFALPTQHAIWSDDTYDNIRKAHESFGNWR